MGEPQIVAQVKRMLIDRLFTAGEGRLPRYEWEDVPGAIMPAIRMNGRTVRIGCAVGLEQAEFGSVPPYTPYPLSSHRWDEITDYLLLKSNHIEVRSPLP